MSINGIINYRKRIILISAVSFLIILAIIAVVRFGLGGPEDTWLCENGVWVKHGQPSKPAPLTGCGQLKTIANFEECAALGQPISESYPRQCRYNGQIFTEDIGNELLKTDLIRISNPRPNQKISSPLTITGQARGNWFFEASFPIDLYDGNNNLLGTAIAQAQSEWMTTDFVPFTAQLKFGQPSLEKGLLILRKDNPSALPEHDDALIVPVKF